MKPTFLEASKHGVSSGLTLIFGKKADSSNARTRFIRGAAGSLALKIGFSAGSLVLNILLTRMLGAYGYGVYAYAFAWVTLLGVPALLGSDQLLVREMAAYQAKSAWGEMRGLLQQVNRNVLLVSVGLAILGSAVVTLRPGLDAPTVATLWIALAALPLITLTRVRQATLQGLHHVVLGSLPEMLIQPVLMILFVGGTWWLFGPVIAPWAMAIRILVNTIGFVIGVVILKKLLPESVRTATPVPSKLSFTHSMLPLMFLAGVGMIYGQADLLILGALKGAKAVGFYAVADRSAELVNFVIVAVNSALAPTMAGIFATGDRERLRVAFTKVVRITCGAAFPVGFVLIVFGGQWLHLTYGPMFEKARGALAILSAGQIVCAATGPVGLLLIMTGHEKEALRAITLSAVVNVTLCLTLIPKWELTGAATAAAASSILWSILLLRSVHKNLGMRPSWFGRIPSENKDIGRV